MKSCASMEHVIQILKLFTLHLKELTGGKLIWISNSLGYSILIKSIMKRIEFKLIIVFLGLPQQEFLGWDHISQYAQIIQLIVLMFTMLEMIYIYQMFLCRVMPGISWTEGILKITYYNVILIFNSLKV